eukprot:GHVS01058588.1.p1 GENE.GHVS01058588.1~~GHVS01058588.1.p1  ORF type:complete len:1680 (-),score=469.40 GHVS01058588.1:432-5471(-)
MVIEQNRHISPLPTPSSPSCTSPSSAAAEAAPPFSSSFRSSSSSYSFSSSARYASLSSSPPSSPSTSTAPEACLAEENLPPLLFLLDPATGMAKSRADIGRQAEQEEGEGAVLKITKGDKRMKGGKMAIRCLEGRWGTTSCVGGPTRGGGDVCLVDHSVCNGSSQLNNKTIETRRLSLDSSNGSTTNSCSSMRPTLNSTSSGGSSRTRRNITGSISSSGRSSSSKTSPGTSSGKRGGTHNTGTSRAVVHSTGGDHTNHSPHKTVGGDTSHHNPTKSTSPSCSLSPPLPSTSSSSSKPCSTFSYGSASFHVVERSSSCSSPSSPLFSPSSSCHLLKQPTDSRPSSPCSSAVVVARRGPVDGEERGEGAKGRRGGHKHYPGRKAEEAVANPTTSRQSPTKKTVMRKQHEMMAGSSSTSVRRTTLPTITTCMDATTSASALLSSTSPNVAAGATLGTAAAISGRMSRGPRLRQTKGQEEEVRRAPKRRKAGEGHRGSKEKERDKLDKIQDRVVIESLLVGSASAAAGVYEEVPLWMKGGKKVVQRGKWVWAGGYPLREVDASGQPWAGGDEVFEEQQDGCRSISGDDASCCGDDVLSMCSGVVKEIANVSRQLLCLGESIPSDRNVSGRLREFVALPDVLRRTWEESQSEQYEIGDNSWMENRTQKERRCCDCKHSSADMKEAVPLGTISTTFLPSVSPLCITSTSATSDNHFLLPPPAQQLRLSCDGSSSVVSSASTKAPSLLSFVSPQITLEPTPPIVQTDDPASSQLFAPSFLPALLPSAPPPFGSSLSSNSPPSPLSHSSSLLYQFPSLPSTSSSSSCRTSPSASPPASLVDQMHMSRRRLLSLDFLSDYLSDSSAAVSAFLGSSPHGALRQTLMDQLIRATTTARLPPPPYLTGSSEQQPQQLSDCQAGGHVQQRHGDDSIAVAAHQRPVKRIKLRRDMEEVGGILAAGQNEEEGEPDKAKQRQQRPTDVHLQHGGTHTTEMPLLVLSRRRTSHTACALSRSSNITGTTTTETGMTDGTTIPLPTNLGGTTNSTSAPMSSSRTGNICSGTTHHLSCRPKQRLRMGARSKQPPTGGGNCLEQIGSSTCDKRGHDIIANEGTAARSYPRTPLVVMTAADTTTDSATSTTLSSIIVAVGGAPTTMGDMEKKTGVSTRSRSASSRSGKPSRKAKYGTAETTANGASSAMMTSSVTTASTSSNSGSSTPLDQSLCTPLSPNILSADVPPPSRSPLGSPLTDMHCSSPVLLPLSIWPGPTCTSAPTSSVDRLLCGTVQPLLSPSAVITSSSASSSSSVSALQEDAAVLPPSLSSSPNSSLALYACEQLASSASSSSSQCPSTLSPLSSSSILSSSIPPLMYSNTTPVLVVATVEPPIVHHLPSSPRSLAAADGDNQCVTTTTSGPSSQSPSSLVTSDNNLRLPPAGLPPPNEGVVCCPRDPPSSSLPSSNPLTRLFCNQHSSTSSPPLSSSLPPSSSPPSSSPPSSSPPSSSPTSSSPPPSSPPPASAHGEVTDLLGSEKSLILSEEKPGGGDSCQFAGSTEVLGDGCVVEPVEQQRVGGGMVSRSSAVDTSSDSGSTRSSHTAATSTCSGRNSVVATTTCIIAKETCIAPPPIAATTSSVAAAIASSKSTTSGEHLSAPSSSPVFSEDYLARLTLKLHRTVRKGSRPSGPAGPSATRPRTFS